MYILKSVHSHSFIFHTIAHNFFCRFVTCRCYFAEKENHRQTYGKLTRLTRRLEALTSIAASFKFVHCKFLVQNSICYHKWFRIRFAFDFNPSPPGMLIQTLYHFWRVPPFTISCVAFHHFLLKYLIMKVREGLTNYFVNKFVAGRMQMVYRGYVRLTFPVGPTAYRSHSRAADSEFMCAPLWRGLDRHPSHYAYQTGSKCRRVMYRVAIFRSKLHYIYPKCNINVQNCDMYIQIRRRVFVLYITVKWFYIFQYNFDINISRTFLDIYIFHAVSISCKSTWPVPHLASMTSTCRVDDFAKQTI